MNVTGLNVWRVSCSASHPGHESDIPYPWRHRTRTSPFPGTDLYPYSIVIPSPFLSVRSGPLDESAPDALGERDGYRLGQLPVDVGPVDSHRVLHLGHRGLSASLAVGGDVGPVPVDTVAPPAHVPLVFAVSGLRHLPPAQLEHPMPQDRGTSLLTEHLPAQDDVG